jgi:hypothetical protein
MAKNGERTSNRTEDVPPGTASWNSQDTEEDNR